jgi:hypothetical protein
MSEDGEMRDICNRFLDAIEARRMDVIEEIMSPDLQFWANFTNQTKGRDEMLKAISDGYAIHRRRTYDDRRINSFPGGFVSQHSCNITRHDGSKSSYWAGLVAEVRDGRIVRVDEYMDSGKFPKPAAK